MFLSGISSIIFNMKKVYDVAIIGAGPAGLAAGLYAARAGLECVIVEKASVGGLASTTPDVENYPGVKSADGFSLCYTMLEQCQNFGAKLVTDEVVALNRDGENISLPLKSGDEIICRRAVITAGATPRKLGVKGEAEFTGKGVSYCATCDGAFFRGKTVAVVGGGNTAVEEALYLENLAKKVYLIHRRDKLRADDILAKRLENSGVTPVWDSVVAEVLGKDKVTEIILKNTKTDSLTSVSVDGVFVAIGQTPNSAIFEGLNLDGAGYVVTDEDMHTNLNGVLCAGDIRSKSLRQIVTACADGAIAATIAARELL